MKFWTILVAVPVICIGVYSCEETTEVTEEAAVADTAADTQKAGEADTEPEAKVPSPAEVCGSILEAVKAKDEAKLVSLCKEGAAEALGGEGVKDAFFTKWAESSCGEEAVDDVANTAVVKVTAGEDTMDASFAKVEDAWKFDIVVYLEKYPATSKVDAAKGKKGKKKAKRRGKRKGKRKKAK